MKMTFSILALISAVLTIFFEYRNRRWVWFFKPLTMVLMIALAWNFGEAESTYRWLILAGLGFSLIGDVLLIDRKYFVYGLASFLIAHLFYIGAFFQASKGEFRFISLTAFLVGLILFAIIQKGVERKLKIPVIFYSLAIAAMLSGAINFYLTQNTTKSQIALIGACFFVASDSILGYDKFNREFYYAKLLILATYFFAQWLIANTT